MRVLLTNDDGGPDPVASGYIKYLVSAILEHTDWDLTIAVPFSQKSWIGKAHFAGHDITVKYIYSSISKPEDTSFHGPFPTPQSTLQSDPDLKEWCLIDNGTPATSTDIGVNHLCPEGVDLVLSGPNVGRNSSVIYALSSGTIGGAMEGCHQGKKAIALSYAYRGTFNVEPDILKEGSLISVKIIQHLWDNWAPNGPDLYSINIPVDEDLKLGKTPIVKAPMLVNRWSRSLYKRKVPNFGTGDIVDESTSAPNSLVFKWDPDFDKVHKDIAEMEDGNFDGQLLEAGKISVTGLMANFMHAENENSGEIILPLENMTISEESVDKEDDDSRIILSFPSDAYISQPLNKSLNKHFKSKKILTSLPKDLGSSSSGQIFHYGEYEDIDHDLLNSSNNYHANAYTYRKALIRKHYLSNTIQHYVAKHPDSILTKAWPQSYYLELDYAEFLDDALDENWELRCTLEDNEQERQKVFIVKPSMSDKGQGIRLFRTIDDLQAVFDSFDEDPTDDEGETAEEEADNNRIIISQLRHFLIQEYISKPLLLPQYQNKKFHIRTYVLTKGRLQVWVYDRMLMLFSHESYKIPSAEEEEVHDVDGEPIVMSGHLTNTCLQTASGIVNPLVVEFGDSALTEIQRKTILDQIHDVTGEVFKAAVSVDRINFQPLPNAFEVFGLDFLVDEDLSVNLLEVNAFPDFKQTGDELKGLIDELFDDVIQITALDWIKGQKASSEHVQNMTQVLDWSDEH